MMLKLIKRGRSSKLHSPLAEQQPIQKFNNVTTMSEISGGEGTKEMVKLIWV